MNNNSKNMAERTIEVMIKFITEQYTIQQFNIGDTCDVKANYNDMSVN